MVCGSCGTENEGGRKFCKECAARLAVACPNCGFANTPDSKFCGECATALGSSVRGAAGSSTASHPTPVAERRLVSVLFADLVGFTPFAEERDAEEVRDTLSRYFELGREIVGRYGGTVEKFIGDALMAVWGAPTAHEDDPERAVRAALELVDAVPAVAAGVQARAAVMTGEAAVTLGATDQGMVAGDLVNTASRLQGVAEPGTVLVGEATRGAAGGAIAFEPAGERQLKGREGAVPAWRALRVVAELGGRNRAEQLEAPFVGRDEEMRLIKELFHATGRERRPRLVSVTGPAGIGKSRLAWEFAKYIDGLVESVWWHAGRSPSYGEGVTFWALGEMVRERAQLAEADDEATTRERIAATVAEWVPDADEARWIEEALLALLGVETERVSTERLFAAWRTFFERISARGTVVLLFEDMHWADEGLLDFIDHLLEWSRDVPLFVLTLARPELFERRSDWATRPRRFTSIVLEPLGQADIRALLAGLVPGLPAHAAEAIAGRSDGIPLYAVETVRMLLAEGRLTRNAEGVYEPADDLTRLDVPPTLTALIAARLDALEPSERSLVADAAVLGQSFTQAALAAVSGVDEAALEPRLRALVRRELLTELRDPRSPERGQYGFVQSLIREVAYATLSRRDRRVRHLAAARHFEAVGSDELAGALAGQLLAAHADSAPGPEADAVAAQARIALRAAAERASVLNAHAQAMALYEQALSVTTVPADRAELLQLAGQAASDAGRHDSAEHLLREAVELRTVGEDTTHVLRAVTALAQALIRAYRSGSAIDLLRRVLANPTPPGEWATRARSALAWALLLHGDHEECLSATDQVLIEAEAADLPDVVADTLITRGGALSDVGRSYEGIALLRAAIEMADEAGWWQTSVRAQHNLIATLGSRDPAASLAVGRGAIRSAWSLGMPSLIVNAVANAVEGSHWTGEWDALERDIERALELDLDPGDRAFLRTDRIRVRAARGLPDAAMDDEVFEILEATSDVDTIATANVARAELALWGGRYEEARELWMAAAAVSALNALFAYPLAARAAIWLRDERLAREALVGLQNTRGHGKAVTLHRRTIEAAIAALEGKVEEALTGYRDALAGWRDAGLPVLHALTAIDMAYVLDPSLPEVRQAVDGAREILTRLSAVAILNRLDHALASGHASPAPTSRTVACESVSDLFAH